MLHTAQLELAENPIKKEEFPRESLKFDIKVGSDGSKFIRNMDLIKSATLPKKFDFLSKSMNISPNKLGLDEIDESSVQNEQNDAVSPQKSNPLDKSLASCLICFDKPPDAVFMDCGHGGFLIILFFYEEFIIFHYFIHANAMEIRCVLWMCYWTVEGDGGMLFMQKSYFYLKFLLFYSLQKGN